MERPCWAGELGLQTHLRCRGHAWNHNEDVVVRMKKQYSRSAADVAAEHTATLQLVDDL